jgi:hypothetical protein
VIGRYPLLLLNRVKSWKVGVSGKGDVSVFPPQTKSSLLCLVASHNGTKSNSLARIAPVGIYVRLGISHWYSFSLLTSNQSSVVLTDFSGAMDPQPQRQQSQSYTLKFIIHQTSSAASVANRISVNTCFAMLHAVRSVLCHVP